MHFSTDLSLNTEINVVCKDSNEIDVHVGFLQEGHIYEIQFGIPNHFPDGWKHPELVDSDLQILSIDSVGKCVRFIDSFNMAQLPISRKQIRELDLFINIH